MILIGSFPTHSIEWKTLMHAILGRQARNNPSSAVPYIDSRLKAVHCTVKDITDRSDEILHQKRVELWVDDAESLAVLIYRLDELYIWLTDDEYDLVERSYYLLRDFCVLFAGQDENSECWLSDHPNFITCGNCGESMEDNGEVQDQVWLCYNCGWEKDYQSEWPYLHSNGLYVGRLDEVVKKHLKSSSDEKVNDAD